MNSLILIISKALCVCVCLLRLVCPPGDKQFVCPPGDKHFPHTVGGTNIFHTQGGQTFLYMGGTNIFVGAGGGGYDVEDHEEEDVSEASKLSAGARILGAHRALKF